MRASLEQWAAAARLLNEVAEGSALLVGGVNYCGPVGPTREVDEDDPRSGLPPLIYKQAEPRWLAKKRAERPTVGYAQGLLNRFLADYSAKRLACVEKASRAKMELYRKRLKDPNKPALGVDCWFWTHTDAATRMFQICTGLKEDGKIGPHTWRMLELYYRPGVGPKPKPKPTCPPPWTSSRTRANSLAEYAELLRCIESSTPSYSPRGVLSLVRQIYYGSRPWSRNRTRRWNDVIPCTLTLSDPRRTLGIVYTALQDSAVTRGIDLGHVFAGLDAMVCPSATTRFSGMISITVTMPNEEVATWGGDVGSAAAQHANDTMRGAPGPLSKYLGGSGGLASNADLQGDVDAHAIRRGVMRARCGTMLLTPLQLPAPLSRVFNEYYVASTGTLGAARAQRFRCLLESMGATIRGRTVTNEPTVTASVSARVANFAYFFYLGTYSFGPLDLPRISAQTTASSIILTRAFIRWLERHL